MTAKVAQYVTIIDRSNKVIGNSRQFKDVFREAKSAYQDRKAEIKAQRRAKEEVELQKAIQAVSIQEETERASTIRPDGTRRRSSQRTQQLGRRSPPQHSGSNTPYEGGPRQMSLGEFNDQLYGSHNAGPPPLHRSPTMPVSPHNEWDNTDAAGRGLVRAQTDLPLDHNRRPSPPPRSQSADDIDLDLAYGEYHPESLIVLPEEQKEKELKNLVARCKMLLEEADCAGHSARAIIAHLQKNPDTLAAVGLTLAEISNIASKMAPGAMGMIAKSSPAVMALLASPQFLIAVGVSVGVTVIAIGGYKIVKKIKDKQNDDEINKHVGPGLDEAVDVHELDRIERWRRGIPESTVPDDTGSIVSGTTVEGEFITPFAAQSMGHLPVKSQAGRSKTEKTSSKNKDKDKDSKSGDGKKKHRKRRSDGDDSESVASRDSQSSRRSSASKTKERSVIKVKKPSPLSKVFSSRT